MCEHLQKTILDCVKDLWQTWSTYPRKVQAYVEISAFASQFRHGGEKDYLSDSGAYSGLLEELG